MCFCFSLSGMSRKCHLLGGTVNVLRVNQLTQQREGHFHTEGSLIRSHRSKTAALSSYREFPFEKERGLYMTEEGGGEGRGEAGEEVSEGIERVVVRWRLKKGVVE